MYRIICDKCFKESDKQRDTFTPRGWERLHVKADAYQDLEKHVCPKCCEDLGVVRKNNSIGAVMSIKDRLFDVLMELVHSEE